jgi:hypothetical protein
MPALSVAFSPDLPVVGGAGLDFWGVFLSMTPVTEPFKVASGVIERVTVTVMNLAPACFAAPLTWLRWFQPSSCLASPVACFGLSGWILSLGKALTCAAAIGERLKPMALSSARHCVRGVLSFWTEPFKADRALLVHG